MSNNRQIIQAVRGSLSSARLGTYEAAAGVTSDDDLAALALYAWNTDVSGALLGPLHLCEVVIRNAVADALNVVYGSKWPWSPTFERSLPDPTLGYSPRRDLQSARRGVATVGKVIPELKFVFWQKMFTARYDTRIWWPHLRRVMSNVDPVQAIPALRQGIYNDLEGVRLLGNRIAHHEPVFRRNLTDDYQKITNLVGYRCQVTLAWLQSNQTATALIAAKPLRSSAIGAATRAMSIKTSGTIAT